MTVKGKIETGTPNSHVARSVPFPDFLDDMMQALISAKSIDQVIFGHGDQHMLSPNSQNGWFAAAVRRATAIDPNSQRVTPNDLRHTAASLAVSAGANVKALQRMLGHASAAMTLSIATRIYSMTTSTTWPRRSATRDAPRSGSNRHHLV